MPLTPGLVRGTKRFAPLAQRSSVPVARPSLDLSMSASGTPASVTSPSTGIPPPPQHPPPAETDVSVVHPPPSPHVPATPHTMTSASTPALFRSSLSGQSTAAPPPGGLVAAARGHFPGDGGGGGGGGGGTSPARGNGVIQSPGPASNGAPSTPCGSSLSRQPSLSTIGIIDETNKARLLLHHYWEDDRRPPTVIVEKRIRERAKAQKELEQFKLACAHPNLVRYLFTMRYDQPREGESLGVFIEFVNLGSLRAVLDGWARQIEAHEARKAAATAVGSNAGVAMSSATEEMLAAALLQEEGMGSPTCSGSSALSTGHRNRAHRPGSTPLVEGFNVADCRFPPTVVDRVVAARVIGLQVLNGLLYFHLVPKRYHRDVKPANILLRADGRVKLCDFDAVKNAAESGVTFDGTTTYMAPEMVRYASTRVDGKCDSWAVGIVLFEIATGRHPFAGIPIARAISELSHVLQALPWETVPHPGLRSIIRALLTEDNATRISCADALRHEFFTTPLSTIIDGAIAPTSLDVEEADALQRRRCELHSVVAAQSPRRDIKAEEVMKKRGVVVDASNLEAELESWRLVRGNCPSTIASSTAPTSPLPVSGDAPAPSTSPTTTQLPPPAAPSAGLPSRSTSRSDLSSSISTSNGSESRQQRRWRIETDGVMRRITGMRQTVELAVLENVLSSLGHQEVRFATPTRPPPMSSSFSPHYA